jgi:hypothetical protein
VGSRGRQGNGSLVEAPAKSGRWRLRYYRSDTVTGCRRRRSVTFEALNVTAARARAHEQLAMDGAAEGSEISLRATIEEFLAHSETRGRSPETMVE